MAAAVKVEKDLQMRNKELLLFHGVLRRLAPGCFDKIFQIIGLLEKESIEFERTDDSAINQGKPRAKLLFLFPEMNLTLLRSALVKKHLKKC